MTGLGAAWVTVKVMNDPYYEISLVWWFIIITISVMGNYFHFDTHNYMVIFIILGFIFNVNPLTTNAIFLSHHSQTFTSDSSNFLKK